MVTRVSIGICAHNEEGSIPALFESLLCQVLPESFVLHEILVVASGCTDRTDDIVRSWSKIEPRIRLISERYRNGKASSINQICERYAGDVLVLVNADASLFPGSLSTLLEAFDGDDPAMIACGMPVLENPAGLLGLANAFSWNLHNRTLQTLSDLAMPNHCCDELMAIRRGVVECLPRNLINDGAYIAALAASQGLSVRFCPAARVRVKAPGSFSEFLMQRHRILRGHHQIRRLLGIRPMTLEGVFRQKPQVAARILGAQLAKRPSGLLALLAVALPIELCASLLAYFDELRRAEYNALWPRGHRSA